NICRAICRGVKDCISKEQNQMRRIGIMGGTFNPIHMGHLLLAEWVKSKAELNEIWLIPNGISYMKARQEVAPAMDRLKMTELAAKKNEHFRCLDLEIKRNGYTYTYETLEELVQTYPEDEFYFILGADCLFTLETWKYPERILECCKLIAAVRDEASMEEMRAKKTELEHRFGGEILLLPFVRLSLSSTEIRERIKQGKSVRYMVPDSVLAYIEEKGLYREKLL
ncbi:MAG: nicotinate-nucleotide adenylyltransferase, partial [Acetatifactor sp.]|nr:nicotinate-nucleotide adenylyltransferase [Acetatifactor sp.]